MSLLTVNLAASMLKANRRALEAQNVVLSHQASLDQEAQKLIDGAKAELASMDHTEMMKTLGFDYKVKEAEEVSSQRDRWAHLSQERIFTKDAIRVICQRYGLRFLPSTQYKGQLDEGIAPAVEALKAANHGAIPHIGDYHKTTQFMIAAPKESFVLSPRPKDPLLFCALGGDRFYLVHKWGNDLSVLRAVSTWFMNHRWLWSYLPCALLAAWISYHAVNDPRDHLEAVICFGLLGGLIAISVDLMLTWHKSTPWAFTSEKAQWDNRFLS